MQFDQFKLGTLEEIIALAIRKNGLCDIAKIQSEINVKFIKETSQSAIYTALKRLRKKGYIEFQMGAKKPIRGGKRKKYYALTPKGQKAIDTLAQLRAFFYEYN